MVSDTTKKNQFHYNHNKIASEESFSREWIPKINGPHRIGAAADKTKVKGCVVVNMWTERKSQSVLDWVIISSDEWNNQHQTKRNQQSIQWKEQSGHEWNKQWETIIKTEREEWSVQGKYNSQEVKKWTI